MNFFAFVIFSFSPRLSLSLFLPVSLSLPVSLPIFLSRIPLSFSNSTPVVSLSFSHSCFLFIVLSFSHPNLYFSLSVALFLSPTPVSLPIFSLCHSPAPVSLSIVLSPIPDSLSPIPVSLFIFISLTPSFSHTLLSLLLLSLSFSHPIFLSISLEPWSLLLSYSEVVIYIYSQFISLEFQTLYELKLN